MKQPLKNKKKIINGTIYFRLKDVEGATRMLLRDIECKVMFDKIDAETVSKLFTKWLPDIFDDE